MKHFLVTMMVGITLFVTQQAFAQQGFGTNQPAKSAAVDIVSTKRGLLIPRIALTSTELAAPVTDPANSLLVYNTANSGSGETAVTQGFYYWVTNKWVRFISSETEKTEVVTAGNNVAVTTTTDGNETTFEVGLDLTGATADQVLVTKETAPGSGEYEAIWVDASSLFADLAGTNGITRDGNDFKLGGTLTDEATVIATNEDENTLAITGLQSVDALDGTTESVLVMDANGVLKKMSHTDLVADAIADGVGKTLTGDGITVTAGTTAGTDASVANSVLADVTLGIADNAITTAKIADNAVTAAKIEAGTADNQVLVTKESGTAGEFVTEWQDQSSLVSADNGLTKVAGNNIQLGGALSKATEITTDDENTLAISGLQAGNQTNRIVVVNGDNALQLVSKSLYFDSSEDFDASGEATITDAVQEIMIDVNTTSGDINVTLPAASTSNIGQVFNIKKVSNEPDENYVNISAAGGMIDGVASIYGGLSYQGWIIKSTGTTWKIVGRN